MKEFLSWPNLRGAALRSFHQHLMRIDCGLANIYLHYAFDLWVQHWRKQPGRGDVIVVRYADDSVLGFEDLRTARAFLDGFREQLVRFGDWATRAFYRV